jgi:hypothetical protein
MEKVLRTIIDDTFKQITFLIENSNSLKDMSYGLFNPNKLETFRDYINIIYLLKMDKGNSMSKLNHSQYIKILDAGVLDENLFNMSIITKKLELSELNAA